MKRKTGGKDARRRKTVDFCKRKKPRKRKRVVRRCYYCNYLTFARWILSRLSTTKLLSKQMKTTTTARSGTISSSKSSSSKTCSDMVNVVDKRVASLSFLLCVVISAMSTALVSASNSSANTTSIPPQSPPAPIPTAAPTLVPPPSARAGEVESRPLLIGSLAGSLVVGLIIGASLMSWYLKRKARLDSETLNAASLEAYHAAVN